MGLFLRSAGLAYPEPPRTQSENVAFSVPGEGIDFETILAPFEPRTLRMHTHSPAW